MITQKLSLCGDTLCIKLPQAIIQQVGWKEGILVNISIKNEQIILSPAKP